MWLDVIDLRDFYASPLGRVARRMIRERIRDSWPDVTGQTIVGVGFATPYLGQYRQEARRVIAAMPAPQGVIHWPVEGPGETMLCEEAELPLPDLSVDRLIMVHAIECAEQVRPLMREVWRVLAGNGRLLVIAPNRRGIWARLDRTPFGFGSPYTNSQLSGLLRDTMFAPVSRAGALYVPPARSRMIQSSARAWENVGVRWFKGFGGVVMVEASKQIYAATPAGAVARRRSYTTATNP